MSPWTLEIRPLAVGDRQAVCAHWLDLDPQDRYQRFGLSLSDEALWRWAQGIDGSTQRGWGAWRCTGSGRTPRLAGVLQLTPARHGPCSELALSVQAPLRRLGIGTRLLVSALASTPTTHALICHHGHVAVLTMAARLGLSVTRSSDGSVWLRRPSELQDHPLPGARCLLGPLAH